jgi:hypothetical protein
VFFITLLKPNSIAPWCLLDFGPIDLPVFITGMWGFLHIPAKRCNPGSRRQSGLGPDPDLGHFPNDFVHIHRLGRFTELVAPVEVDVLPGDRGNLLH